MSLSFVDTFWHILNNGVMDSLFPALGDSEVTAGHSRPTGGWVIIRVQKCQWLNPNINPRNQARKPLPTRVPWRFQMGWRPSSETGWSWMEKGFEKRLNFGSWNNLPFFFLVGLFHLNFCFWHLPIWFPIKWSGHVQCWWPGEDFFSIRSRRVLDPKQLGHWGTASAHGCPGPWGWGNSCDVFFGVGWDDPKVLVFFFTLSISFLFVIHIPNNYIIWYHSNIIWAQEVNLPFHQPFTSESAKKWWFQSWHIDLLTPSWHSGKTRSPMWRSLVRWPSHRRTWTCPSSLDLYWRYICTKWSRSRTPQPMQSANPIAEMILDLFAGWPE